jgi:hypothetical protein
MYPLMFETEAMETIRVFIDARAMSSSGSPNPVADDAQLDQALFGPLAVHELGAMK